ncbi:hypothetical protein OUZ56_001523 [Daphnia magna]|uniref:Uncharacterized protein n=1 Tax=Daphnia magna TaxID=35525 RepID=A0ABR0A2X8_9CRUS|nr:hypothetical protein OUZ56_001523 [Daphnia magna]
MESKTCISTLSAEDLRFHLLSTNKLPAGIPEKLLVKDPQPDVRQVLPDVSFQHIEPGVTDFDVSDPLQQDSFHQANATADKTTQRLARFFLELRAKHNVSHSAIDFIAKNIDTIFKDVAQFCDLETNLTLTNIEKATSKLNSHQKRIRYFTSNMGFVEPVAKLKRLREVHREEPRRKRPTQDSSPIQKKPRVTKRPHVKKNADYIFNEAECQFKVEWLKSHPPGGDNDTVIIEYSKATFGYRQKEIKQTLTEPGLIMKEYPRFKDFQNGSLFQVEFQLLYPDAKNFEKVFKEKFLFKILALANKKNIDIPDCPDECLKAVFVLLKLTPSIVKLRKVNFRLITERLIVFLKDNADLIQLSETRDPHLKQPFICCMGTMETPTNFWIVIDRDIILCAEDVHEI